MTQVLYRPTELEIVKYGGFEETDQDRLEAVINSSFKPQEKMLVPDYFRTVHPSGIYISGDYEAAAITRDLEGAGYLDKIGVDPKLQGKHLGSGLLRHIFGEAGIEPRNNNGASMMVRADPENTAANILYGRVFVDEYSGSVHVFESSSGEEWNVYQIGLEGEALERKIELVANLLVTMIRTNQS